MKKHPVVLEAGHIRLMLEAWDVKGAKPATPDGHLRNINLSELESLGLLCKEDGAYHTTDKGSAFIKILCDTPIPEQANVWEDKRTQRLYHPYGLGGSKLVQ